MHDSPHVQIPRPAAVGDKDALQELRAVVISEPLLAGAVARPKGFARAQLSLLAGFAGPYFGRRATHPLPPTPLYIAVTPVDLRLFSKSLGLPPYEIGRWRNRTYRATLTTSRRRLQLDLDLERLGRVTVLRGPLFGVATRAVFELVERNASGPVA